MNIPLNTITIQFDKLELGTYFQSWTGADWIKVSDITASPPHSYEEFPFETDEWVTV